MRTRHTAQSKPHRGQGRSYGRGYCEPIGMSYAGVFIGSSGRRLSDLDPPYDAGRGRMSTP